MSPPLVSVIIPHFNDLAGLTRCVQLLERQTYPRSRFEIIVADNNSRCGLGAVRAAAPSAKVTPAPIQGAGPARNAAISVASGEVLALTDSDCTPDKRWLERGVQALAAHDFIGGAVVATSRDPERPNPVEAFERVFAFDFKRYIEEVGFTGTGNMFMPKALFDAVGPFRTGVAEDMEWSFRARDKGFRLGYAPEAIVGHPARRDWAELKKRWARMEEEHFLLANEQSFGRVKWLGKALLMPLSIAPHAGRLARTDRLTSWRDRMGAFSVLVRLRIWRTGKMLTLLGAAMRRGGMAHPASSDESRA